ncbi:MAG: ABC transporter ATP-binding protein [Acutalibacteraceae bacterium]
MKDKKSGMIKTWFMPYLKKYKGVVAIDLFCAALTTVCELVLPMLVRRITEIAVNNMADLTVKVIAEMAVLYAALKGVDMLAGYYMIYVGHSMGVKIEKSMREDLFSHLLRVPLSYYDTTKVGQLMSRITTDMFDVSEFAHHCPEEFFIFALKMIVSFAVLGSINLPLTLVSFAMLPLMLLGTMYFRKKMHKAFKDRRVIAGDVNARTETSLLGIRVIKSFTQEKHEEEQFKQESTHLSEVQQASYRYMARLNSVVRFFDGMMYLIMILMGGMFIIKGKITTADYAAYLLYDAMLIAAVKRIVEFIEQFEKGLTGIERFREVMEIDCEKGYSQKYIPEKTEGEIEFKNVTFSYADETEDVLEHINITVKKGENVAIVGPSGSGKTTMCSLISHFYDINDGCITLDGKDISQIELGALRQAVGVVEQDVYMFSGTVIENILYGNPSATREDVINAAKLAGAHEFICALENGYDTFIGERGTMLSGGQKQRISIARVFLKNPPVLILDEATSALDNRSEHIIKKSLETLTKGRTTLTIAHRLSTIKNADRILVLTEKGIEEQGTHEELLKKGGIYSRLYNEY